MTGRIDIITQATASSPPVGATESGRLFLIGRTERGPVVPTLAQGWADYVAKFGSRVTDSISMSDDAKCFFDEGGPQIVVLRAVGPTPVKATRNMDTGKLVVTAVHYGAYGNAITCSYVASTKTLTVIADGVTEVYTGASASALVAACAASKTVVVTSNGTLPAADQASAALASGDDDYANVVLATTLAALPADAGPGMVAWSGKAYSTAGTALADHCAGTDRLALLTCASGADRAASLTAIAAIAAYTNGSSAVLAWPEQTRTDGVVVSPIGFAAACRARAHAVSPGTPPWGGRHGKSRTGLVPTYTVTDAEFIASDAARVSVIHAVYGITTLDGWHLAAPIDGNANLDEGSQRDTLNAMSHDMAKETVNVTGSHSSRGDIGAWAGALAGIADRYVATGDLTPPDASLVPPGVTADPGYVIDAGPAVNSPTDLAAGTVKASVQARCVGSIEFATITITASDAASASF